MASVEKDGKDLELKKHVGSIHCSNTLTLLQRKISNVLLYHAYDELLDKDEHEIAIKVLCDLIGYASHDYETIKRALKALISTVLEWNLLGDSKGNPVDDWNASSILSSVGIKGGLCTYSYSNRLKKLLYMPEIYGRVNIAIQARFKSNYALALYENCIRYQNLPYTRWFALATFRKLMGVPEEKYTIFRDFKKRVLDKSVEEINRYSDIVVEPEIEREGLKVHRIRFKLNQRDQHRSFCDKSDTSQDAKEELIKFGLKEDQATNLLREYPVDLVKQKIHTLKKSSMFNQAKIKNVMAYLRSALKENYKDPVVRHITSQQENNNKQEEELKKEYSELIGKKIDEAFEQFDESTKDKLIKAFENTLQLDNNRFVLEKYFNKGLSNRIVKSIFRNFLKENFDSLLPKLDTFLEYKSNRVNLK